MKTQRQRGFTLTELFVVIIMMAVVSSMLVIGMRTLFISDPLRAAVDAVKMMVIRARTLAVEEGSTSLEAGSYLHIDQTYKVVDPENPNTGYIPGSAQYTVQVKKAGIDGSPEDMPGEAPMALPNNVVLCTRARCKMASDGVTVTLFEDFDRSNLPEDGYYPYPPVPNVRPVEGPHPDDPFCPLVAWPWNKSAGTDASVSIPDYDSSLSLLYGGIYTHHLKLHVEHDVTTDAYAWFPILLPEGAEMRFSYLLGYCYDTAHPSTAKGWMNVWVNDSSQDTMNWNENNPSVNDCPAPGYKVIWTNPLSTNPPTPAVDGSATITASNMGNCGVWHDETGLKLYIFVFHLHTLHEDPDGNKTVSVPDWQGRNAFIGNVAFKMPAPPVWPRWGWPANVLICPLAYARPGLADTISVSTDLGFRQSGATTDLSGHRIDFVMIRPDDRTLTEEWCRLKIPFATGMPRSEYIRSQAQKE